MYKHLSLLLSFIPLLSLILVRFLLIYLGGERAVGYILMPLAIATAFAMVYFILLLVHRKNRERLKRYGIAIGISVSPIILVVLVLTLYYFNIIDTSLMYTLMLYPSPVFL